MEFTDRNLKCVDCGAEFVFTAGEQLFFHDKQFKNDPKHCKQCKAKRARGGPKVRPETRTTCSECKTETTVPFGQPRAARCFAAPASKSKPMRRQRRQSLRRPRLFQSRSKQKVALESGGESGCADWLRVSRSSMVTNGVMANSSPLKLLPRQAEVTRYDSAG